MTIDGDVLIGYLEGTLPEKERIRVDDWVAASPENEKVLEQVYFIMQTADRLQVMDSVDPEMALVRFKERLRKQNKKAAFRRTWQLWQKVAAMLFIPVLVVSAYFFMQTAEEREQMVEMHTNPGVVSVFDLPDGTKVWLNAGSSLKFPESFRPEYRQVELTGQGYFEVVKKSEQPFLVKVNPAYSVEVLGTSFNVSAYKDDDMIETTLVDGSVQLNIKRADGRVVRQLLKPGEKAEFRKTNNKLSIATVDTDNDIAWRNGGIVFRNHSMAQVLKTLARFYNVKFDVKDKEVLNAIITARFEDEPLPQVMEYIRLASDIKYKINKTAADDDRPRISIVEISKK